LEFRVYAVIGNLSVPAGRVKAELRTGAKLWSFPSFGSFPSVGILKWKIAKITKVFDIL